MAKSVKATSTAYREVETTATSEKEGPNGMKQEIQKDAKTHGIDQIKPTAHLALITFSLQSCHHNLVQGRTQGHTQNEYGDHSRQYGILGIMSTRGHIEGMRRTEAWGLALLLICFILTKVSLVPCLASKPTRFGIGLNPNKICAKWSSSVEHKRRRNLIGDQKMRCWCRGGHGQVNENVEDDDTRKVVAPPPLQYKAKEIPTRIMIMSLATS
ncbi:hypothetical protein C8J56DRAFT_1037702 [Mycena floridula]|nr:hypothetical protein C8J56DRAFT_1037702 [Mycena floridula]